MHTYFDPRPSWLCFFDPLSSFLKKNKNKNLTLIPCSVICIHRLITSCLLVFILGPRFVAGSGRRLELWTGWASLGKCVCACKSDRLLLWVFFLKRFICKLSAADVYKYNRREHSLTPTNWRNHSHSHVIIIIIIIIITRLLWMGV